jgi:glutamine cyclotransferase
MDFSWHQFSSLPHIAQLPLNRQLIEYEIYNQNLIHEVYLTQQLLIQQEVVPSSAGSAAAPIVEEQSDLPSGCIEFVNNTKNGTYSEIGITTSGPTNYTITWGDGTEVTDVVDGGILIDHDYADSNTEYTARLCFDDISLVTELDFTGDD